MTFFGIHASLTEILVIALITMAVLYFFARPVFNRLKWTLMGSADKASRALWAKDPVAVLKAQISEKADQLRKLELRIREQSGALKQLKDRQAAEMNKHKEALLVAKAKKEAGDMEAARSCAEDAVRYQEMANALTSQITAEEADYQTSLKAQKEVQALIKELKDEVDLKGLQLTTAKAQAQRNEMKRELSKDALNVSDLQETRQEIDAQISKAQGMAQASQDMTGRDYSGEVKDANRKAKADDLLANL